MLDADTYDLDRNDWDCSVEQVISVVDSKTQYINERWIESSINQSINQSNKQFIPHIDNQVQHIKEELMWERGKSKCNTYNTLSPFMK